MSAIRLRRVLLGILCTAGVLMFSLWFAFLLWGRHLPDSTWAKILQGFDLAEQAFGPAPAGGVPKVAFRILLLLTAILAGLALLLRYWDRLQKPDLMVLLPMLLAICSVYGQLNGARLFHGFLPVLTGIYLCFTREMLLQPAAADAQQREL